MSLRCEGETAREEQHSYNDHREEDDASDDGRRCPGWKLRLAARRRLNPVLSLESIPPGHRAPIALPNAVRITCKPRPERPPGSVRFRAEV